ncbi:MULTISPECIES: stage V sporulation protein B [Clostridium]|uniref:Multidrug-efflux transporter n=1 Tax=Clostridium cibarium TaxID=2762247 RepID=A0ABR8PP64_9CLOT|nr:MULTISPECIES: stage V sporulation protein B [Clostridium]MBD7909952.1 stage V sporulation protein B [Clostridium cibarium]
MDKDNFFKNSFLLTASNITTGVIGFIFSIYLSHVLGPEGMGLYNLVMPIYNLFICMMSAGISASISKISAVYVEKNENNNLIRTMKTVAVFNIIWAIFIGIMVFAFAPIIGEYGISDNRTIDAIRVTCPAMVFIALSNILKGYFWGTSKITIPAAIDILEKALRILTVAILIFLFQAKSMTLLVTLCYIALCLGELQSLILLYIYYRHCVKKMVPTYEKSERRSQLLFNVLIICLPLTLNGFLSNIFNTLSTLIIPRCLSHAGFTHVEALSMIGKFTGMAMMIVGIPLVVISSINTLLIPDLSQTLSKGNYYDASIRIRKVIKIAFILGLATTIICLLIPDSLGKILYQRDDLGNYIKYAGISAPAFFTSITMFGILNGINKQMIILRNSLIVAVLELIGLFIFTSIPSINIYGYTITLLLTSLVSLIINLYEVKKSIEINLSITNAVIYCLLTLLFYLVLNFLIKSVIGPLSVLKTIIIIILTFGIFSFLGTFGEENS